VESPADVTLESTTLGQQANATLRTRGGSLLPWLVGAFVGMVVLCGLAYIGICSYMAVSLTRVERRPFTRSPEMYGLDYESVSFPSRIDAIPLDGWLLPASGTPTRLPVIVVHGKGSDRQAEADGHTLDIAAQLVRDGHPVLLFDLRGSGRSGGDRFTLGAHEVRDIGGAIDFLAERGLADDGVDLLGFSMGASTALLVAPGEGRVRAIAEDSGYATLGSILDDQVPKASGLPGVFTAGTMLMARPLLGIDAYGIRPVDGMPALAARGTRLLVIHGDADPLVPISNGYALAAAYGPATQTYFVPGAGHVASYATDPGTYMARLTSFLDGQ
jgi:pimeloyl-ACP methyl ester carboxylesterase